MRGDILWLWPLLLGSALTLATTLGTQWFTLAFQTRRQREARRADFQRTALLQLRDAIEELDDAVRGFFLARQEALERAGGWDMLGNHHPAWESIRRTNARLLLVGTAIEEKALRAQVASLAHDVLRVAKSTTAPEADEHRESFHSVRSKVTWLLGEQLRRLP